jgi:hypothetical protein
MRTTFDVDVFFNSNLNCYLSASIYIHDIDDLVLYKYFEVCLTFVLTLKKTKKKTKQQPKNK